MSSRWPERKTGRSVQPPLLPSRDPVVQSRDGELTQTEEHEERYEPDAYGVEDDLVDLVELARLGRLGSACPAVRRVALAVVGVLLDEPRPPRDVVRWEEENAEHERRVGSRERRRRDQGNDPL